MPMVSVWRGWPYRHFEMVATQSEFESKISSHTLPKEKEEKKRGGKKRKVGKDYSTPYFYYFTLPERMPPFKEFKGICFLLTTQVSWNQSYEKSHYCRRIRAVSSSSSYTF